MRVDYATLIPALKHLLPEEDLDDLGRAVAFIKRLREVTASWFVWAVVLSRFGYGRPGFEQARDWYTTLTGITVWPRPFQMRFKQVEAVRLFRRAFDQAVTRWWDVPGRQHPLARRFADVVVVDSTVMQISDALRSVCWGTRLSAAELKLLVTMSVFGSLPLAADVVPGYQHDMTLFPPMARFRRDTLLLFDKGFVAYERLREIGAASLHYLCPMRLNGNPRIMAIHRAPVHARRALKAHPDGIWLRDVLPPTKRIRTTWDLEVTVRPITRAAADTTPVRTRLIIVAGPQGTQRPYLTDLAATHWTPDALRELYRLRWQVELLFKELTQDLNLGVLPTKDPHAVQIFVWASLIALAVSRTVSACFHPLRLSVGLAAHLRPRLVTRALRATIRLLAAALTGPRHLARLLLPHFVSELLRDIYSPDTERPDSFSRLRPLLA